MEKNEIITNSIIINKVAKINSSAFKKILKSIPKSINSIVSCAALITFSIIAANSTVQAGTHTDWAESVARNVLPENNTYGSSPTFIRWEGNDGFTNFENRTVCSTFVTQNLKKAYGWTNTEMIAWSGTKTPNADRYQEMIVEGNGLLRINQPESIGRGDLIAIKYMPCAGSSATGHIAIALGPAIQRPVDTAPLVPNTVQYALPIVDSSNSDHFAKEFPDTRTDTLGNRITNGAGIGWMRLYRNISSGEIQGYTWSMQHSSIYHESQGCRALAVGRLN